LLTLLETFGVNVVDKSKFDNIFDYWLNLINWFETIEKTKKKDIIINKREKKEIINSKNLINKFDKDTFFEKFNNKPKESTIDKIEKIYFDDEDKTKLEKKKEDGVKNKNKINRVRQIESEYLIFKNKTQSEIIFIQISRIFSRIWVNNNENDYRSKMMIAMLQYFEKYIANESLYFFILGNIMLGHLGSNWMNMSSSQLRQALFALSCNFLGQELEDNLLLNLMHLIIKTFMKYLFNDKVGKEELDLIRKINEFEKIRDEEIQFESRRIDKLIAKEKNLWKKKNSGVFGSNKKLNMSLQSFNISLKSNRNRTFKISGKNNNVLNYKRKKIEIEKKLRVKCEESLRFQYFNLACQWRDQEMDSEFESSIFAELLHKDNFHQKIKDKLESVKFAMFLIFKNIFIINILNYFYVTPSSSLEKTKAKHIPQHHHLKTLKGQMASRVGGWPFEVSMQGLKVVGKLGSNIIKNLIQGYERKVEETKSIFSKFVDIVGKLIQDKKAMEIEINVDGKDIQKMADIIQEGVKLGNNLIRPMVQAFPKDLALTDIFYNQIGLTNDKTMPYFLHLDTKLENSLVSQAVEMEMFYRIDTRFSECKNNEGNRYYLKKIKKTKYGIGEKKCGRKGCTEELSKQVLVKEFTFREIRKKLRIINENNTNIPGGKCKIGLIGRSGENRYGKCEVFSE
jgi:hypothetical protein